MDDAKRIAFAEVVRFAGQLVNPGATFWRDEAEGVVRDEHVEISELSDSPEGSAFLEFGEEGSQEVTTGRVTTVRLTVRALLRDRAKTLARVISARLKADPNCLEQMVDAGLCVQRELSLNDQIGDYDGRAESIAVLDLAVSYVDAVEIPQESPVYTIDRLLGGAALEGSETDLDFDFDIERPEE